MRAGGRGRRVFATATSLIALDTLLFTLVVPALPDLAERGGFSETVAALVFAAFPVGQLATALVAAGVVDRAGRRPAMSAAVVVLALATLAFAFAEGAAFLAGARLLQGIAAGLVWTAGLAAISDITPGDRLGFRIGLAETTGGAAGLLGPVLGGVLIEAVGTRSTFLLAALLPAVALVPVLAMPETRVPGAPAPPRLAAAARRLAAVPRARVAVAALSVMAAILALVEPLLPLDLDARLGLSAIGIGLVFVTGMVAYFVTTPLAGRWSDRRGRRGPLVLGGVLIVVGLPAMTVGPAAWVAVAFAVTGVGMACVGAPSGPLMVEAVGEAGMPGNHGLSSAALTVVFSLGYALGPLVAAASSAVLPFTGTALVAAGLVAVATLWMAAATRTVGAGRQPGAASPGTGGPSLSP